MIEFEDRTVPLRRCDYCQKNGQEHKCGRCDRSLCDRCYKGLRCCLKECR